MPGPWAAALLAILLALGAAAGWRRATRRHAAALAAHERDSQARLQRQVEDESARAVAMERERIFRNLHDDLGAQLLELVYLAPTPEHAERARKALQQMRASVADARRPPALLLDLLDELGTEARQRLQDTGVELEWEQDPALPNVLVDQGRVLHVLRIVREAITNSLKHGEPHRLRIRMFAVAGQMLLDVTDDGCFGAAPAGNGTAGMRERAAEMGAEISWRAGTWGGTKVALRLPLTTAGALPAQVPT